MEQGMKRISLISTIALCASHVLAAQGVPYTLSPAEIESVQKGVRSKLKDPTSPLFGDMKAVIKNEAVTVCGIVNAKNSFGGYTGDQQYIGVITGRKGSKQGFFVLAFGGSDAERYAVIETCRSSGIDL